MTEQIQLEIARMFTGMITTIFTGIMAYLMAKMNAQMKTAAIEAAKVKESLSEVTEANNMKLSKIANHAELTSEKIGEVQESLDSLKNLQRETLENKKIVLDNRHQLVVNRSLIEEMHSKLEHINSSIGMCPLAATPEALAYAAARKSLHGPNQETVQTMAAPEGYSLTWSDEFNDHYVDTDKWNNVGPWDPAPVASNDPDFTYNADRIVEEDGAVELSAWREDGNWAGAILSTDTTKTFQYGYFEVRAKLPTGQGFWPGIWLYGGSGLNVIDIMEFLGGDVTRVYQTLHHTGGTSQVAPTSSDWTDSYHRFQMKWEPDQITFYIDDVQTAVVTHDIPRNPMYLMLNFDVGASTDWGGGPDSTTPDSETFYVSYVRYYELEA